MTGFLPRFTPQSRFRLGAGISVFCMTAFITAPAAADTAAETPKSVVTEINFDTRTLRLAGPLQFDVPLEFTGTVPNGTTWVEFRWAKVPSRAMLQRAVARLHPPTGIGVGELRTALVRAGLGSAEATIVLKRLNVPATIHLSKDAVINALNEVHASQPTAAALSAEFGSLDASELSKDDLCEYLIANAKEEKPAAPPDITDNDWDKINPIAAKVSSALQCEPGEAWPHQQVAQLGFADPKDATIAFRASVPPLEARSSYAFCLIFQSPPDAAKESQLRAQVEREFDRSLNKLQTEDFSDGDLEQLRVDLCATATGVLGATAIPLPTSICSTTQPTGVLATDFTERVEAVLAPQTRARDKLIEFAETARELKKQLDRIRTDAGALNVLLKTAAGPPAPALPPGVDLLAPGLDTQALASGQSGVGTALPPLPADVNLTDANRYAVNFAALRARLADLQATLTSPASNSSISAIGLGADQVKQLQSLAAPDGFIKQARDDAFALDGAATYIGRNNEARLKAIQALAPEVSTAIARAFMVGGTTSGNGATRAAVYASVDAGLQWAWDIDELKPYIGTNVYFRPVNRDAELNTLGGFARTFTRRVSLTFGLTVGGLEKTGVRADLFSNMSFMAGAGIRVTDAIRVGAGAIVLKEFDHNPLVGGTHIAVTPYLSISFDWNIMKTAEGIGKLIPK